MNTPITKGDSYGVFDRKEIHFINEDAEVQRGAMIDPRSHCRIEGVQVQNSDRNAPADLLLSSTDNPPSALQQGLASNHITLSENVDKRRLLNVNLNKSLITQLQ